MKDKRVKFKIKEGMVCSFDPENNLKQKDTGISHVLVLKKIKSGFFGLASKWLVQNADDVHSEPFSCSEFFLEPSNSLIMRFPADVPSFNDVDVADLEFFVKILNNEHVKNSLYMILLSNDNNKSNQLSLSVLENKINRLTAIKDKIKFCNELMEI